MTKNSTYFDSLLALECPDSSARILPPLIYNKGEGSIVYDADGKSYIDLTAGFAALSIGHNHPEVVSGLTNYIQNNGVWHGLGDVYASVSKVEYLDRLRAFLPGKFKKLALSLSGSQAVEMAIKTALLKTKKPGILTLKQGYHGLDLGAMALTGMEKFRLPFAGFSSHPSVDYIRSGESIAEIKSKIANMESKGIEVGQILVEPVLGRYGNKHHPDGWLDALYKFCQKSDMLLIFDEVFTGLGRTGIPFRAFKNNCDIICMGKAIGGGMPVSAIATTEEIMEAWPESEGEAIHTGTFFGHPLSCKVGLLTLDVIAKENLIERSKKLGKVALEFLIRELKEVSSVNEVRGEGLMLALEFKEPLMGVKMMELAKNKGVILIPSGEKGKSISITPALNIPKDQFLKALSIICEGAKEL